MHALPHLILPGLGQSQITIADAVHRLGVGLHWTKPTSNRDIVDAASRLLTDHEVQNRVKRYGHS